MDGGCDTTDATRGDAVMAMEHYRVTMRNVENERANFLAKIDLVQPSFQENHQLEVQRKSTGRLHQTTVTFLFNTRSISKRLREQAVKDDAAVVHIRRSSPLRINHANTAKIANQR